MMETFPYGFQLQTTSSVKFIPQAMSHRLEVKLINLEHGTIN